MDKKTAAILLASLIERIGRDQTIGTVSSHELAALKIATSLLGGEVGLDGVSVSATYGTAGEITGTATMPISTGLVPSNDSRPKVELVLDSLNNDEFIAPNALMCLDFGTAMSKAFATLASPARYLDLELGAQTGGSGYAIPSTVFIADDGRAYFGSKAIELSQELVESGRERLDSIKGWLSLRQEGNLDGETCLLTKEMNPTSYKLSQGDLIRIYLAYLTDTAETALSALNVTEPRYVKRRFARPCWPDVVQTRWADNLMRTMLAEAQILADTFTGRWAAGIEVAELKVALDALKDLGKRPDHLIDKGIPEPVAVAAGAIDDSGNLRDAFMVVDVGAGTTDFGLFIATTASSNNEARMFQIPASIQGLMQAGDKVDSLLRGFITRRESIDHSDTSGKLIFADLTRKIRGLKETLFVSGELEYVLSDGTVGKVDRDDFLKDDTVVRFGKAVAEGFKRSLEAVDESWLKWLAMDGVRLHVVLTGGSSQLPMMQALGKGFVEVKGYKILLQAVDPRPDWMDEVPVELTKVYPQLAVAIGGAAETMPETLEGPSIFGGATQRGSYMAGHLHVAGS